MSLNKVKRLWPRSLRARFTILGAVLFLIATIFIVSFSGVLLHREFESRVQEAVLGQLDRYARFDRQSPIRLFRTLQREHEQNRLRGTWVRLQNVSGVLWETVPADWEQDREALESVLVVHLKSGDDWSRATRERYELPDWANVDDDHHRIQFEEELLMASRVLPDGSVLVVGESLARFQIFIRVFGRSIFRGVLIIGAVSVLVGWLLSRRLVLPLQNLVRTTETVASGTLSARVPVPDSTGELEELTRLFNQMLDRIEGLVGTMNESLDNVAHDLRTPLTKIRASVESVLQRPDPSAEELREALLDTAEEAEKIGTLLNALMNLAEAQAGTLKLQKQPVDLRRVAEEVFGLYEMLSEEQGVALTLELPEEAVTVEADPIRLRQAVANLVDNALKFTPEGGRTTLSVTVEAAAAQLVVTDTGIGIPPEEQPRIFERLYRADKSRATQGLGLGLSLVQAIVRAHEAHIEVASVPEEGSRFALVFPKGAPSG